MSPAELTILNRLLDSLFTLPLHHEFFKFPQRERRRRWRDSNPALKFALPSAKSRHKFSNGACPRPSALAPLDFYCIYTTPLEPLYQKSLKKSNRSAPPPCRQACPVVNAKRSTTGAALPRRKIAFSFKENLACAKQKI